MRFVDAYEVQYSDCIWLEFAFLEAFVREVLMAAGVPEPDAHTVTDVLIESDRRGIDSHGIGRLKPIYIDRIRDGILSPTTAMEIVRDGKTTALIDGHNGMGHVIAKRAMELAIDKAKHHGLGMVAVRHSTHFGIAGYYAGMATQADQIGMVGCNARPSIAPTFGVTNMLGTNPLTFGIPTDEGFPFMLDCATSITQRGKLEHYARIGKDLPEGWVIDEHGRTRTDTSQVLIDLTKGKAALTPLGGVGEDMGGYKGYGYAAVVELLSSALSGNPWMRALNGTAPDGAKAPIPIGHFFLAIDVAEFTEPEAFKAQAGAILRELRASAKDPEADHIFTPGEKEFLAWEIRRRRGCPVPRALQRDMETMRAWYGLKTPFPWD